MRNMIIFLFWGVIASCSTQQSEIPSRLDLLTKLALSSNELKTLNASIETIGKFVNRDKNSLYFQSKTIANAGVIAIFDEQDRLKTAFFFTLKTKSSNIQQDYLDGKFDGTYLIQFPNNSFVIELLKSKIDVARTNSLNIGRTAACGAWDSTCCGALACAGRRLDSMSWWDASFCFASFPGCMIQLIGGCIVDGCPIE